MGVVAMLFLSCLGGAVIEGHQEADDDREDEGREDENPGIHRVAFFRLSSARDCS